MGCKQGLVPVVMQSFLNPFPWRRFIIILKQRQYLKMSSKVGWGKPEIFDVQRKTPENWRALEDSNL